MTTRLDQAINSDPEVMRRIETLPRWAQQSIRQLQVQNERLSQELAIARGESAARGATGRIVVRDHGFGSSFAVPDRANVEFYFPDRAKIGAYFRQIGEETFLEINAEGTLQITPRASNCAYLKPIR
jgi:hypothetical protein